MISRRRLQLGLVAFVAALTACPQGGGSTSKKFLELSFAPTGTHSRDEVVTLTATATDDKGNPGTGEVRFRIGAGTFGTPGQTPLMDTTVALAGGKATIDLHCDLSCPDKLGVLATWSDEVANVTVFYQHLLPDGGVDDGGQGGGVGGGAGGGSGPADLTALAAYCAGQRDTLWFEGWDAGISDQSAEFYAQYVGPSQFYAANDWRLYLQQAGTQIEVAELYIGPPVGEFLAEGKTYTPSRDGGESEGYLSVYSPNGYVPVITNCADPTTQRFYTQTLQFYGTGEVHRIVTSFEDGCVHGCFSFTSEPPDAGPQETLQVGGSCQYDPSSVLLLTEVDNGLQQALLDITKDGGQALCMGAPGTQSKLTPDGKIVYAAGYLATLNPDPLQRDAGSNLPWSWPQYAANNDTFMPTPLCNPQQLAVSPDGTLAYNCGRDIHYGNEVWTWDGGSDPWIRAVAEGHAFVIQFTGGPFVTAPNSPTVEVVPLNNTNFIFKDARAAPDGGFSVLGFPLILQTHPEIWHVDYSGDAGLDTAYAAQFDALTKAGVQMAIGAGGIYIEMLDDAGVLTGVNFFTPTDDAGTPVFTQPTQPSDFVTPIVRPRVGTVGSVNGSANFVTGP